MKLQLNNILKMAAAFICGTAVFACNDLSELEERVDSLESRVQALETQLPALNDNVSALSAILANGNVSSITINSEGDLVITTTGGETFTLSQGSVGNAPLLSVDADGYWLVSYDGGENYSRLKDQSGDDVYAAGSDMVIGVSADGYWQVSYDGGKTYEDVTDASGAKVPALSEGSSDFFQDLAYNEAEGTLTLTLSDGKVVVVNVVSDFLCQIQGVTYGTAETFSNGETRSFTVTMRGVASAQLSVPYGWSATLSDVAAETATLAVTAPGAATKAMADTDSDVVITAVSDKGLTAIAKMTVGLSDTPAVTVAAGTSTATTLSFTVTPNENVTSYKYMLYAQTTAAPATADDFASATEVTENLTAELVLDRTHGASEANLAANTTYVLYVLPVGSSNYGAIRSCTATTGGYNSYYEMYQGGLDLTIAGVTYNRATYGDAVLVTSENSEISAVTTGSNSGTAVFFIDPNADASFTATSGVGQMLLIGNSFDQKSPLTASSRISLNQGTEGKDGIFVCYNLDVDFSGQTNYTFAMTRDGNYKLAALVDCDITLSTYAMFAGFNTARVYDEIALIGCNFNVSTLTNQTVLISPGSTAATINKITFNNNIVYSTAESGKADFRVMLGANSSCGSIVMKNNTFVNTWHSGGSAAPAFFGLLNLNDIDAQYNILWTDKTFSNYCGFFRCATGGTYPSGTTCSNNIAYKPNITADVLTIYGIANNGFDGAEGMTVLESDPFAGGTFNLNGGIFVAGGDYASYGAQR